ncbi:hypothetical protein R6231_14565 [Bacillus cytotoxicus]|uniref:hypothetical protein n=1 Tax=Bacillus cereus group TaxID=86661 RepID=UPI000B97C6B6|nr:MULTISPECIES: hypothetical protein [Bacillus cereus group]AWC30996.1 hypothetical protein CG483_022520 [Bacillus cytotoxicus]AWC35056.1 hypothetical protein CG482_022625 [Bacillus cytotoxicus]AWC39095.1 hypothetical protein CG481_022630 [Bacillus cytotoxicus]AWC43088.1 hypothetical protein CG480_022355 [Bacillus cytotoxicus]AWC46999.1 hypothetical protein CG479_021595 [Bacillus cytotoxicus]
MNIIVTFHLVSGLRRSTVVQAENIEDASEFINGELEDGFALFDIYKMNGDESFSLVNEGVEKFEVYRRHVMCTDYEVQ